MGNAGHRSCQTCAAVQACRPKAIVQPDPGEPPYLDFERCRGCQICLPSCPFGAMKKVSQITMDMLLHRR